MSSTKLTSLCLSTPHEECDSATSDNVLLRTAAAYVSSIAKSKYFSIKKQLQN